MEQLLIGLGLMLSQQASGFETNLEKRVKSTWRRADAGTDSWSSWFQMWLTTMWFALDLAMDGVTLQT